MCTVLTYPVAHPRCVFLAFSPACHCEMFQKLWSQLILYAEDSPNVLADGVKQLGEREVRVVSDV